MARDAPPATTDTPDVSTATMMACSIRRGYISYGPKATSVSSRQQGDDSTHCSQECSVHGGQLGRPALEDDMRERSSAVSYTHLRAHETPEHLVCRLLLEKKKKKNNIIR
eukprot:TRINITY_DN17401_c0_g1_i10.p1 TRINITY_DN17401_c0_g1~~TRINITY_DN17401_c0_g1_i10.p1  ORF type:complete len:110 (-),score=26.58 TRINITY_DN17401_c0_g1_i10:91-420(-)